MSIRNSDDANRYYQLLNELVDEYMEKGKIRPSNLRRYLEPGSERFKKFLIRNKLNEITGIDRVLSDVIEDRVSMESDGVLTFESFKFFESDEFKTSSLKQCIYKDLEKADIGMEKALADFFDTNLGSIDVVDSDKHIFYIEDVENDVVCLSEEDIELIKENMCDYLCTELKKKEIELIDNSIGNLSINLGEFIESQDGYQGSDNTIYNSFKSTIMKKLENGVLEDIIENLIGDDFNGDVKVGKIRNYQIFYWG